MPPWLAVDHTEHQWLTRKWTRDLWQQLLCFSHEAFQSPLFSKDLTLLKIQPGCLWISCIIPICSLFISYSEKEPLMSHLRKPMLSAFNHPLLIMLSLHAVGWGGHSSPEGEEMAGCWGWLAAPLLFSVFCEIPSLWHGACHVQFLQLYFFLLLGHIQQQFHLQVRSSSNDVPKTRLFYYNGPWKPWGDPFIIRS